MDGEKNCGRDIWKFLVYYEDIDWYKDYSGQLYCYDKNYYLFVGYNFLVMKRLLNGKEFVCI